MKSWKRYGGSIMKPNKLIMTGFGPYAGRTEVNLDDLEAIKQSLLQKWAPGKRITDFNGDGRLSIKDIVDFLKR